jgi:hypothetical protein
MLLVFLCGIFGAMASILGKISLSETSIVTAAVGSACIRSSTILNVWPTVATLLGKDLLDQYGLEVIFSCSTLAQTSRLVVFVLMVYCNALMLSYFLRALRDRSSLAVTVVSSATNFLITGLLGGLILGEDVNGVWYIGARYFLYPHESYLLC